MNVILIIGLIAFIAMFVFWTAFRNWIGRQLNALWTIIVAFAPTVATWLADMFIRVNGYIRTYLRIIFWVTAISIILMCVALLINSPGLTALAFVLAISAVLLVWMPAGILLRVFRITNLVIPKTLRMLVAWTAFVGFLGLMCPEVITFKSLLGAALVGFIFLGITTKMNVLDKVIYPLVVIMCLWTAWGYFWPESFRSTTRYTESWAKRIQTHKDRGSIDNETDAATTYGQALQDITVLYELDTAGILNDAMIVDTIKVGTIVKIASHKEEIKVVDGQGFIQIQRSNKKGSFLRAKKYYVEAEYVQLASPREVTPENHDLLKNRHATVISRVSSKDSIFTKGVYFINVNGKTPFIINVSSNLTCGKYSLASQTGNEYKIVYDDGTLVKDGPNVQVIFPNKPRPRFVLESNEPATIKLVVG